MAKRVRTLSSIPRSSVSSLSTSLSMIPDSVYLRLRCSRTRGIQRNQRAKITKSEKASLRIDIGGTGSR